MTDGFSHELEIGSVKVKFPYDPYQVQLDYMSKVIECLKGAQFGLLESPTGTGKTLSLLCSSLAWLQYDRVAKQVFALSGGSITSDSATSENASFLPGLNKTKIIYASRTHSQLSQVISEFARTGYHQEFICSVLGSRDQLCINSQVTNAMNVDKNILCRSKVKARSCEFYTNLDKNIDTILNDHNKDNDDIENLKKLGIRTKVCPYYLSRKKSANADIIFLPYNYLFDSKIRKTLDVNLENSVIILDEAHNVLRNCEDANSMTFEAKDIAVAITECDYVTGCFENESLMKDLNKDDDFNGADNDNKEFTAPEVLMLKEVICNLESTLINVSSETTTDFEGDKIIDILNQAGINSSTAFEIKSLLDRILNFLSAVNLAGGQNKGKGLTTLKSILDLVYSDISLSTDNVRELLKSFFKLYVEKETGKNNKNTFFNFWCFSPGFCMKSLVSTGIRSIILTSGTLKPISSFQLELNTDFNVTLQNKHVISSSQLCVRVLPNGIDGTILSSSYQTRSDPKYLNSLGVTILKIFRNVPDGVLIFFPSYSVMNSCIDYWKNFNIWGNMNSVKPIFVEPKQKGILSSIVDEFRETVKRASPVGACFMAVCRGKVAEGIDFADKDARAVLITGIPYPNIKDARISLKRKYLDYRKTIESKNINGNEWYNLEATRAINQAIGRVIRHKNDYGAVIFLDKRFGNMKTQLSDWIQPGFQVSDCNKTFDELAKFFKISGINHPQVSKPTKISSNSTFKRPLSKTTSKSTESTSAPLPLAKRKKIVLKTKNVNFSNHKDDDRDDVELALERKTQEEKNRAATAMKSVNNAQSLVITLKAKLTKEELMDFKTFVKDYKTSSDFKHILKLIESDWFRRKLNENDRADIKTFLKSHHHVTYDNEILTL